jgi:hypothetical protein
MDFDEWCYESKIEEIWHTLKDMYGDSMPLLSEYKKQQYEEYVLTLDKKDSSI